MSNAGACGYDIPQTVHDVVPRRSMGASMAGGDFGKTVWCMVCGRKAERVYDGDESDDYKCEKGHKFGIDWHGRPPSEPQWPPPADMKDYVERLQKGASR